jgi:hypothetical protein
MCHGVAFAVSPSVGKYAATTEGAVQPRVERTRSAPDFGIWPIASLRRDAAIWSLSAKQKFGEPLTESD